MRFLLLSLALFAVSANAMDCSDLDGWYEEETGFFGFEVTESVVQTQGKVSYNGSTFYYHFRSPLRWDRGLRACAATTYFRVGYYGAFGRIRYCDYPVTTYLREKYEGGYIQGTIRPTEIYPGPGCYSQGKSDSKYTMYRERRLGRD